MRKRNERNYSKIIAITIFLANTWPWGQLFGKIVVSGGNNVFFSPDTTAVHILWINSALHFSWKHEQNKEHKCIWCIVSNAWCVNSLLTVLSCCFLHSCIFHNEVRAPYWFFCMLYLLELKESTATRCYVCIPKNCYCFAVGTSSLWQSSSTKKLPQVMSRFH